MIKNIAKILITLVLVSASFNSARAENESWYFTVALGYGIPQYPTPVKDATKALRDAGASNFPITFDLGFYWPIGAGNTIIGPSINGLSDSYSKGTETVTIIKTGIYFSTYYTFNAEPGDGFFLRGDVGFPRIGVELKEDGFTNVAVVSDVGFGVLAGGGYGIALGGTRLLFSLNEAWSRVKGYDYGTTTFSFGAMF